MYYLFCTTLFIVKCFEIEIFQFPDRKKTFVSHFLHTQRMITESKQASVSNFTVCTDSFFIVDLFVFMPIKYVYKMCVENIRDSFLPPIQLMFKPFCTEYEVSLIEYTRIDLSYFFHISFFFVLNKKLKYIKGA